LYFKDGFDMLAEGYLLCTANRVGSLDYYLPKRIYVSGCGLLGVWVNLDDGFSTRLVKCANYVPALPGRFE
jgi:hypothetical protein